MSVAGGSASAAAPAALSDAATPVRPRVGGRPHVIVISGPADGAGKTSLAAALSVALLTHGAPTGVLDLDLRRRALSLWLNRRKATLTTRPDLVMPAAATAPPGGPEHDELTAARDLQLFIDALGQACEAIVVDAPIGAGPLARAAHKAADVIVSVTPESAVEIAGLFENDEDALPSKRPSRYVRMIWEATMKRTATGDPGWLLVASRGLSAEGGEAVEMTRRFAEARRLLGAGPAPTIPEDAAWRRGFDAGLTPLETDSASGTAPQALRDLIIALRLPALEGARLAI